MSQDLGMFSRYVIKLMYFVFDSGKEAGLPQPQQIQQRTM